MRSLILKGISVSSLRYDDLKSLLRFQLREQDHVADVFVFRSSRGDEAQVKEIMEPPDVGCYSDGGARCAMGSFCFVSPGEISWPLMRHSKSSTVVGSSGESLGGGTSSLGRCVMNVGWLRAG